MYFQFVLDHESRDIQFQLLINVIDIHIEIVESLQTLIQYYYFHKKCWFSDEKRWITFGE